jgi:hypothetical protein
LHRFRLGRDPKTELKERTKKSENQKSNDQPE